MNAPTRTFSTIEPLEARIAPAAVVMLTDIDGDTVAVKTSKGTAAQLTAALKLSGMGLNGLIREIDFSTVPLVGGVNPFAGTDLAISVVKRSDTGDGRVNVGYIDASASDGPGMDGAALLLGKVKIAGDLGQIDAGTGGSAVAVKSLVVQSIGAWGGATQGANASPTSNFSGAAGVIKVAGGVFGATLSFTGAMAGLSIGASFTNSSIIGTGDLANVLIKGGVINSSFAANSIGKMDVKGVFHANVAITNTITSLKVGGDITYGKIAAKDILNLAARGSLIGLDGVPESGSIVATGKIVKLALGGDLRGGATGASGRIYAAGNITSILIGGSIIGPTSLGTNLPNQFIAGSSSSIDSGGNIGGVKIGRNIEGPIIPNGSEFVASCSSITATGDIGSVTVGGSIIGSRGDVLGTAFNVRIAATHLGTITVAGDVVGDFFSEAPEIFALGSPGKAAIGKLAIGGSLRLATVNAGHFINTIGVPRNADGVIGSVTIGGDLDRATIATLDAGAGVTDNGALTSRIDSITIRGLITGNSVIRAEHVASVKLGGAALKLQPGSRNDTLGIGFPPGSASIAEYM